MSENAFLAAIMPARSRPPGAIHAFPTGGSSLVLSSHLQMRDARRFHPV